MSFRSYYDPLLIGLGLVTGLAVANHLGNKKRLKDLNADSEDDSVAAQASAVADDFDDIDEEEEILDFSDVNNIPEDDEDSSESDSGMGSSSIDTTAEGDVK